MRKNVSVVLLLLILAMLAGCSANPEENFPESAEESIETVEKEYKFKIAYSLGSTDEPDTEYEEPNLVKGEWTYDSENEQIPKEIEPFSDGVVFTFKTSQYVGGVHKSDIYTSGEKELWLDAEAGTPWIYLNGTRFVPGPEVSDEDLLQKARDFMLCIISEEKLQEFNIRVTPGMSSNRKVVVGEKLLFGYTTPVWFQIGFNIDGTILHAGIYLYGLDGKKVYLTEENVYAAQDALKAELDRKGVSEERRGEYSFQADIDGVIYLAQSISDGEYGSYLLYCCLE